MEEREKIIRTWFKMWLEKQDSGILELFSEDAQYIESWGPEYRGAHKIKLWFDEWNRRGTVVQCVFGLTSGTPGEMFSSGM